MRTNRWLIVAGGLVAGTLDIAYAVGFWATRGVAPTRVLQSVASGVLGDAAFAGGAGAAALGLVLHYMIAMVFAVAFAAAAVRWPRLVRRPVLAGVIYGFGIYWVMNLIVVPASAFPRSVVFTLSGVISDLSVHMLLIGVPIACATSRALAAPEVAAPAVPREAG